MKNQKGITLIALVITIIVLIILAGVAINLTLGDNGILKYAEFARTKYQNSVEKEANELAKIESYINMAGMLFLFGLMILVTVKDIFMLF